MRLGHENIYHNSIACLRQRGRETVQLKTGVRGEEKPSLPLRGHEAEIDQNEKGP